MRINLTASTVEMVVFAVFGVDLVSCQFFERLHELLFSTFFALFWFIEIFQKIKIFVIFINK